MSITDIAEAMSSNDSSVRLPQSTSTIYATALANSENGTVVVAMDGDAITQPEEEETEVELNAESFVDGQARLPSVPYSGTVTVLVGGDELTEEQYQIDDDILTINSLSGNKPVEITYIADVSAGIMASEFHTGDNGDIASLSYKPSGSVTMTYETENETVSVPVSVDAQTIIAQNVAAKDDAFFEIDYDYNVSITPELNDGVFVLPNEPEEITVKGVTLFDNQDPQEVVWENYTLDGDVLTIEGEADAFLVEYVQHVHIELNYTDTYDYEVEDTEEEQDEEDVVVEEEKGRVELEYEPMGEITIKCDGEPFADFIYQDNVITLGWNPDDDIQYSVAYEGESALDMSSSDFANGAYELPVAPKSAVTVLVDGQAASYELDETALTVPSLVEEIPSYTVIYQAEKPVQEVELPTSPSVYEGETVQVTVVNGTPVVTAVVGEGDRQDEDIAQANLYALSARQAAEAAEEAAESAVEDAARASEAAQAASDKADAVNVLAQQAAEDAEAANDAASQAVSDAATAQQAANAAGESASRAQAAADAAQAEITEQKEYFWHDALGAHILSDTDEVTGLRTRQDMAGGGNRIVRLNQDGTETTVAVFGEDTVVGDENSAHIELSGNRQSFKVGADEVAYIAINENNEAIFYMTKAVVVKDLVFGDWVFTSLENRNLVLKWIGESE